MTPKPSSKKSLPKPDREFLDEEEHDEAWNPDLGEGTPRTAPERMCRPSLGRRQPVLLAALAATTPQVMALILDGAEPLRILAAAGTLLAGAVAQRLVTPIAEPRLDDETPLTPE